MFNESVSLLDQKSEFVFSLGLMALQVELYNVFRKLPDFFADVIFSAHEEFGVGDALALACF